MNFEDVSNSALNFSKNTKLKNIMFAIDATLESFGVYYYDNWLQYGEVVDGPNVEKYWVQLTLMYPENRMPDPTATLRIIKNGGKVRYTKSIYSYAKKITSPDDVTDTPDRKVKLTEENIWLVTLRIPRKYLDKDASSLDLENSYFKRGEDIEGEVEEDFAVQADDEMMQQEELPTEEPTGASPEDKNV